MGQIHWSENVIIADGDYIDRVAFDMIVNFERIIGRRIPKADMARWIDCVALDGGLRPDCHATTQVVLVHSKERDAMRNFAPGNYDRELNATAFRDNLGEFIITSLPTEEMTTVEGIMVDVIQTVTAQSGVKRVMIIPNGDDGSYNRVRRILRNCDESKRVTVFTMQPEPSGNFREEILGYSLLAALGIKSEELTNK